MLDLTAAKSKAVYIVVWRKILSLLEHVLGRLLERMYRMKGKGCIIQTINAERRKTGKGINE